jgi:DhnA family fructose-bisphosphate aldolase class Ia
MDMQGIDYRIKEFLPGSPALLVDVSASLSLGALPGLEDFEQAIRPILPEVEGVICSPGQLRRLERRTREEAALLVRMDWTNTLRGEDFPLPPEKDIHLTLLEAGDALALGAAGMVTTFLLGYEETIEAGCQKTAVQLALEGKKLGLPLLVEVRTSGPRVSLPGKAVELGASYALECAADVIVIPHPGQASLQAIASMLSVPWLVKPTSAKTAFSEWEQARELGAAGLWLDHHWLAPGMPLDQVANHLHSNDSQPEELNG